jgi:hypothetical protein
VIAVTLAQRAATGAMDCNHYAATLAMGQGATMQLARRTCGTCARLGKCLHVRSPWCSVHQQTREATTTMQPQAHWAVAVRCMRIAAHVASFSCHVMSSDVLSRPSVAFCAQRSQWRPFTACSTDTHRRPGTKLFSTCYPTNLLLWRVRIVGSITIQTSWPRRLKLTRQSSNIWSVSSGGYGPCLACKITEAAMVATSAKDVARMCYRVQPLPCMFNY